MSRHPLIGTDQADARYNDEPLPMRVRALCYFDAADGVLTPRNDRMAADYVGRTAPASIHDSAGTAGTIASSAPAFTSIAWGTAGVRDDEGLLLSDEEAVRFLDASTEELALIPGALTLRHEFVKRAVALDEGEEAPLVSYTNDDASGPWWALFETADGVVFRHYNGTEVVESTRPAAAGTRCAARALLHPDGSVQLALIRKGVASGAESVGTRSSALAFEPEWGTGGGCKLRLNEFGDGVTGDGARGEQIVRLMALYGGIATRRELEEVI